MTKPTVYIGTSGYHYDDWKGTFYSEKTPASGFLQHYCRFFNALELNGTFYQMPQRSKLEKYLNPELSPLVLSMKAYRELTHGHADSRVLRTFISEVKPLIDGGILKNLLFQFPFSFGYSDKNWTRLKMLVGETPGVNAVMEFRHASWFQKPVLEQLRSNNLNVCGTDMPVIGKLPGFRLPEVVSMAYFRFHGRNSQKWWNHDKAWERYDYLYTEELIAALAGKLAQWIKPCKEAHIYFNNHYQGQAVQNAQQLLAFFAE